MPPQPSATWLQVPDPACFLSDGPEPDLCLVNFPICQQCPPSPTPILCPACQPAPTYEVLRAFCFEGLFARRFGYAIGSMR